MANFFWGDTQGKNKHHWLKWSDLCYPTKEGGMGFKSIQNSCDAFAAKNWWNFRTGNSLLKSFLEAKYCKRLHPVARKGRPDQSHTWRRLMNIKDKCETHMIWKIGKGNLSFWWNNWSGKGSIAKHLHLVHKSKNTKVVEFIREGKWDESHLRLELPANIVDDIMKIQIHKDQYDKIISDSFKVAFFMMKLLRSRISTDENVRRFKVHGPSMCNCCISHQEESIQHLFVEGDIARLWKTFGNSCGIKFNNGSIRTVVMQWWLTKTKNKIQETMYQCLPTVFCWEIWKSRCNARFEGNKVSTYRIVEQVTKLMGLILNKQFPCLNFRGSWQEMCSKIDGATPTIITKIIKWLHPPDNFLKLNTDGCSKGNRGEAVGGGILKRLSG
ncbi:hypothetical protein FXO38_34217 [Capsicum annuum]|nr:hypothetical protein FXO38_34217 [Capsicum annuum]